MGFRLRSAGATDVGLKRQKNEDYYCILEDEELFILADGMGGHASGQVASRLAVDHMVRFLIETVRQPGFELPFRTPNLASHAERALSNAIQFANERVYIESMKDSRLEGMGTTVCATLGDGDDLIIGHVGDSRIYRLRGGAITQVTRDHSLLNHYLDTGKIKPEEADSFQSTNVIVRAVGLKDYVEPSVQCVAKQPGDVYVTCSDGLSDLVDDWTIQQTLLEHGADLDGAAQHLVRLANQAGGKDNITVILVAVTGERVSRGPLRDVPREPSAPDPGVALPSRDHVTPREPVPAVRFPYDVAAAEAPTPREGIPAATEPDAGSNAHTTPPAPPPVPAARPAPPRTPGAPPRPPPEPPPLPRSRPTPPGLQPPPLPPPPPRRKEIPPAEQSFSGAVIDNKVIERPAAPPRPPVSRPEPRRTDDAPTRRPMFSPPATARLEPVRAEVPEPPAAPAAAAPRGGVAEARGKTAPPREPARREDPPGEAPAFSPRGPGMRIGVRPPPAAPERDAGAREPTLPKRAATDPGEPEPEPEGQPTLPRLRGRSADPSRSTQRLTPIRVPNAESDEPAPVVGEPTRQSPVPDFDDEPAPPRDEPTSISAAPVFDEPPRGRAIQFRYGRSARRPLIVDRSGAPRPRADRSAYDPNAPTPPGERRSYAAERDDDDDPERA